MPRLLLDHARTLLALGCMLTCCVACKHSEIWLGTTAHDAGSEAMVPNRATDWPVSEPTRSDAASEDASAAQPSAGSAADAAVDAAADSGATSLTEAPELPSVTGACPKIETGMVKLLGASARLWVGTAHTNHPAPLVLYWHGTGSFAGEVEMMLTDTLPDILAEGGIVASFEKSLETGDDTGFGTWYTGDFVVADQLVACAVAQRDIDPRRIYAAGCSAGGLQAAAIAMGRSNYIAAAMTNSGGKVLNVPSQRPTRVPAAMTVHGSSDTDILIVNFAEVSLAYGQLLVQKGGFAVDCDHGGGHCAAPQAYVRSQWEFLKAHPFGITPEPYAGGLPAGFPKSCRIIAP